MLKIKQNQEVGMKKQKSLLFIVCLVFVCLFSCQRSINQPQEKIYLASGHPEWPPIMWRVDNNKIIGVAPELVGQIFSDLNISIEFSYCGLWDEVQNKAKSGEVDLIVAAYKTAGREKYLLYSEAYTEDPIAIFVKKDNDFLYAKWEDLISKRGVLTIGDSYGQKFDDFIKDYLTTKTVNTAKEAFEALTIGEADYFVYALFSGEKFIALNGLGAQIKILPNYIAAENFYVAISKKSSLVAYLPQINQKLAEKKKDGTIQFLIDKYKKEMLLP